MNLVARLCTRSSAAIFSLVWSDQTCEAYSSCDRTSDLYKTINVFWSHLLVQVLLNKKEGRRMRKAFQGVVSCRFVACLRLCLSPVWLRTNVAVARKNGKEEWQKWHRNGIESRWSSRVAVETIQKTQVNRCRFYEIKSEFSLLQTVALFLSFSVGCRCFAKRLSPVFEVMSLVAPTPRKASWEVTEGS